MIKGFSKLSADKKADVLIKKYQLPAHLKETLLSHKHSTLQELYNQFSENTLSNFFLPYGVIPEAIINEKNYTVPMVTEESSVVAAASKAAKFWNLHGGFKTKVISTTKSGQLFFTSDFSYIELKSLLPQISEELKRAVKDITTNMEKRGGGITQIELMPLVPDIENTFCLLVHFDTVDSMGANFINSCLERMGDSLVTLLSLINEKKSCEITMAILSNHTPECLVECKISCAIENLKAYSGAYSPMEFAKRFEKAVQIATHNTYRAVTHNKGIMNGVDAVVLATGNDFRAIEAGVHAYASESGRYRSLTQLSLSEDRFTYTLTLPLSVGTVGGLTKLHPMAKLSMDLLGNPSAKELMLIIATAGMANNFSAISALITSGIQKGHMKMHLSNILQTFNASTEEIKEVQEYFKDKTISHSAVKDFLSKSKK
jgi:hydroxymethylglutaryl-CoA reductase